MKRTVGRCGNCGGVVTVPTAFMSVNPPIPTCESCGATAKTQGPTISMNPGRDGLFSFQRKIVEEARSRPKS